MSTLGPIFLRRRLEGSSAAMYGLDGLLLRFSMYYNIVIGDHVHVENSDTDLVLLISQIEILLDASNASVSCILTLIPLSLVATECFFYRYWLDPEM